MGATVHDLRPVLERRRERQEDAVLEEAGRVWWYMSPERWAAWCRKRGLDVASKTTDSYLATPPRRDEDDD